MALSLQVSRAAGELAQAVYDFLPGSGNATWRGHVSFRTVAEKVGVGGFCQQGSKLPMVTVLIEKTLELRRDIFEPLIIEIVRAGMVYRRGKSNPVTFGEMTKINQHIAAIGFKFPDLWDPAFLSSLATDPPVTPSNAKTDEEPSRKDEEAERRQRSSALQELKTKFFGLHGESNRAKAGILLERLLNELFAINDLAPREPFRVVGEQIDGSFELDHEIYLMEAKWEREPIQPKDLYVFREKVEGKSKYTRGVFISINGYTANASDALTRGKQPSFFTMDGYDLTMILSEDMDLPVFLRRRQRILAEEGQVSVTYSRVPRI